MPSSYLEYLELLTDVFAECVRKLEPGGRIAVNVANLGRKPYRSLSADVIRILEHDLGLLLRGELIWQKGEGASGSCAWGSFRSAANPVLRDITERVIVASKGRFDRARTVEQRAADGLPHESTLIDRRLHGADARRVVDPARERPPGRPPGAVPGRAARAADPALHVRATTSCSTRSWAAARRWSPPPGSAAATSATTSTPSYVEIARRRVAEELQTQAEDDASRAANDGQGGATARRAACSRTPASRSSRRNKRFRRTAVTVDFVATDGEGDAGSSTSPARFTSHRGGLLRTDVVWRTLGRAYAVKRARGEVPLVLLTSHLPRRPSEGDTALRAAGPDAFFDAIDLLSADSLERLRATPRAAPRSDPSTRLLDGRGPRPAPS